ncbi:UvrD-helicase domain-containing protein [Maridesulfovibrio frigidus]|uniref:UvrD-helicase domain-containing protein n=1 Tax=Maridesulfovibrio frigidus TaxID=340956 RepID=UPI0004E27078|nr:UvrD-helicase domain-containing protein [Maridesulfovibrio frigidus]
MERFIADLHIHSRFTRGANKAITPRLLAAWARVKGIDVIGTGDFTHPEWLHEIETHLVEDGSGLLALRDSQNLENEIKWMDGPIAGQTRFMLQAEVDCRYKRFGKTRKVHNLVYMPDLESARKFNAKLDLYGNLESNGRPNLGIDSKQLLEIVLETSDRAFLVPAHIWTPMFSLFGSKQGFESITGCYGDLASEIFALETGLSSDPEMNWLISSLDKYRLMANSNAHSCEEIGREANVFSGDVSYEGIYRALRGEGLGHKFIGTVEFFPEEGKYHMDGHRQCGVMLDPHESKLRGWVCPVCGKLLTKGVYSRILERADRNEPVQPKGQPSFTSQIPLAELISEVVGTGPKSRNVMNIYGPLINEFGSELSVLQQVPIEDLKLQNGHLAEGIRRMREGQIISNPGFDGQEGTISVYSAQERAEILGGAKFLVSRREVGDLDNGKGLANICKAGQQVKDCNDIIAVKFDEGQKKAIEAGPAPVLVLAGPGTGKTQVIMGRMKFLLERGTRARRILAVTFTHKAAQEINEKMTAMLGEDEILPRTDTIHSLAFEYWTSMFDQVPLILDDESAQKVFRRANPQINGPRLKAAWKSLCLSREKMEPLSEGMEILFSTYSQQKDHHNLVDYTDMLEFWLAELCSDKYIRRYTHFLIDEVHDLSPLQLEIIRKLADGEGDGEGFLAVGDPEQSIYGFRGAAGHVAEKFKAYWPDLIEMTLEDNYRSTQAVLDVSSFVSGKESNLKVHNKYESAVHLFSAPDSVRESSWIAERIKHLTGATNNTLGDPAGHGSLNPGDITVLVRFKDLMEPIRSLLKRQGIPCSMPETAMFWHDSRVQILLGAVRRMLGFAEDLDDEAPEVPEKVIARGPIGLSAYLSEMPPFDQLFWESKPFREMVKGFDDKGGWSGLINWIHMQGELEQVLNKAEKVRIMTMHAAKGMEFEAVFIAGLDDGIVPFVGTDVLTGKFSGGAIAASPDTEEERRLLYVGTSRAKKNLFLSHSAKRPLYNRTLRLPVSRFLKDIPEELVTKSAMVAKKMQKEKEISLLDM